MDDYIKIAVIENTIEVQLIDSILGEKKFRTELDHFMILHTMDCFSFKKGGENYMLR
jgi:hypothetical protein